MHTPLLQKPSKKPRWQLQKIGHCIFDALAMTDFQNRLHKVYKHTGKWARRQGITCFRVYDNDVPGYPFSIDQYESALYVSVYQKPHERNELEQEKWLNDCLDIISTTLQISLTEIFLRSRRRQKGAEQYERLDTSSNRRIVHEQGLKFWVNLTDYLDTGLFLDHRITRKMARDMSDGKNVLNLFAYTGSFSVYMAAGGAREITTVDLSKTYLQWAVDNMILNGFDGKKNLIHHLIHADVKTWLQQYSGPRFDLIIMDPPTFSNSKRMLDILDIQRDHAQLLTDALKICSPGGEIIFSTNYRGFKIEAESIPAQEIREISHLTIPPDFRNKKIHTCFLMKK
jgi:23S rRNA (cytosine1962-C5)-methyltransferase